MTTLSDDIQAILHPLASGGSWAMIAAQGTLAPYITWQRIISTTENTLTEATNIQNTRVQIDAYGSSYANAHTLASTIKTAVANSALTKLQLSEQDFYEPEVKLYRVSMDFSFWSTN